MSKGKNKGRSEVEELRGVVRRLKSQLKYYRRRSHIKNSNTDIDDNDIEFDCPNCGKGFLEETDLLYVKFDICNICGYRKKHE